MRLRAILILLPSLLLTSGSSRAQDASPPEYEVKAAFMFNFAKFVQWPASAFASESSPLFIGVLGNNPFGAELDRTMRGKSINNRPVAVKQCHTLAEAGRCHVLFISTSEKARVRQIVDALDAAAVLTVGETENFIPSGGMVSFFLEGRRIRFDINGDAVRNAGLRMDSKLLELAKKPHA